MVRALAILGILAGVLFIVLFMAGLFFPERIALRALHRAAPDLHFQLRGVTASLTGEILIQSATVSPRDHPEERIEITDARIGFRWRDLPKRRIGRMGAGRTDIVIGEGFLNWMAAREPSDTGPGWAVDEIIPGGGSVELRKMNKPWVRFDAEWNPHPEMAGGILSLHRVVIGENESASLIERITMEIENLPDRRIGKTEITGMELRAGRWGSDALDGIAERWPAKQAGAQAGPWHVEEIVVDGFLATDTAKISFHGVFHEFEWPPPEDGSGSGYLAVSEFSHGPLKVDRMRVEASTAGMARQRIDRVLLEKPEIHLQPGNSEGFFPGRTHGLKDPVPDEEVVRSASLNPVMAGWGITRLEIRDGRFGLSGFGSRIPEVRATFEAGLEQVGLGSLSGHLHSIVLTNVAAAPEFSPENPVLTGKEMQIEFTIDGLFKRRIETVSAQGFEVVLGSGASDLLAAEADPIGKPAEDARPWSIGVVDTGDLHVRIEDLAFGVPNIRFDIRTRTDSLLLSHNALLESDELRTVELGDIVIHSPLDPFAPVLTLGSSFVHFRLSELLRNTIEEITVLHPTLYVGQDLFWYVDEIRRRSAAGEAARTSPSPPWKVREFKAFFGRLAVAVAGSPRVALPLNFQTRARDVSFTSLSDLKLQFDVFVPEENYPFPDYQLYLNRLSGNLRFGLPGGSGASNVVNVLRAEEVLWRQFRGNDPWISVTYDRKGIYSEFGAFLYGGYLEGGFTFFLRDGFPWTGWLSGDGVDLSELTGVLTPHNVSMTGDASLQLQVNATASRIERLIGDLQTSAEGSLHIGRINNLITALPDDWGPLRSSIARIALETLRDFDYTSANAEFWFVDKVGRMDLRMDGPLGSRNFEIVVHDAVEPDLGRWQSLPTVQIEATNQ